MEKKLDFFLVKKKLFVLYILKNKLCNDIIMDIIENLINSKYIDRLNNVNRQIRIFSEFLNSRDAIYSGNQSYIENIPRINYLKKKLSEEKEEYFSKYYKTWLKFQYYLIKTKSSEYQCIVYGFTDNKKLSDILKKY